MNDKQPWLSSIPVSDNVKATVNDKTTLKRSTHGPLAIFAAFTAVIIGMIAFVVVGPNPMSAYASEFGSTSYPSSAEGIISECGDTFTFNPEPMYYGYVPNDFYLSKDGLSIVPRNIPQPPMSVPAFGYMSEKSPSFSKNFYRDNNLDRSEIPNAEQAKRMLWDGKFIVWYKADIDPATQNSIQTFVNENPNTYAFPWLDSTKNIPLERNIAFSGWNTTRSCKLWNTNIATEFVKFASERNALENRSVTPPRAQILNNGELSLINIPRYPGEIG